MLSPEPLRGDPGSLFSVSAWRPRITIQYLYMETLGHYSVFLCEDPCTHIHNLDVLEITDIREVSTSSLETLALISLSLPPDSDDHMWKMQYLVLEQVGSPDILNSIPWSFLISSQLKHSLLEERREGEREEERVGKGVNSQTSGS